jgi:hypothetical protein
MTAANFLINMRNSYEQTSDDGRAELDLEYAERQLDVLEQAASQLAKTRAHPAHRAQSVRRRGPESSGRAALGRTRPFLSRRPTLELCVA